MYKILAKVNLLLLPSFTKQRLDISKAKKWQMAIIGWRYYVTTRALDWLLACWKFSLLEWFKFGTLKEIYLNLDLQMPYLYLYLHPQ